MPCNAQFPWPENQHGCMISIALLPLGGGDHAEIAHVGCPLPAASSQRPHLGNACPVCTGTAAAQHLLLSMQGCPVPSWRLQLQHTKHLAKKPQELLGQS